MQEIGSPAVKVSRGVVYTYLQNAVGVLTALIYFPVFVRILSQKEVGLTVTLGLILALAMSLSSFSLPQAITKFVAEDVGKERWGAVKRLYKRSVRLSIGLGGAASLALLLISSIFSYYLNSFGLMPQLMVLLSANVIILSASGFLNAFLYGLQKFKEIAIIGLLSNIVKVFSVIIMLLLSYGVAGVLAGWIMGDLVGMVLYLLSAHKVASPLIGDDKDVATSKLFEYSTPLYGTSILNYLSTYIDRFLLLGSIGLSGLAVYSVAVTASSFLVMVSYPMSYVLFPFFSELRGKNSDEGLRIASLKATRYTSLVFIPLALGIAVVSYPAIIIFAGLGYVDAALPLAIFCVTMAFTQIGVAITPTLLALGKTRSLLNAQMLGIASNIAIVLTLAPSFGINGVALGRVGLMFAPLGYTVYVLLKSYGFHVDKYAFTKAWAGSLSMALAVLITQLYFRFDVRLTPLYILLGLAIYLAMVRWMKLIDHEDALFLDSILPRRLGGLSSLFTRLFDVKGPYSHA